MDLMYGMFSNTIWSIVNMEPLRSLEIVRRIACQILDALTPASRPERVPILLSKDVLNEKSRPGCLLPEQKRPSSVVVTLTKYLLVCSSTL
jgi:hypothetical protein